LCVSCCCAQRCEMLRVCRRWIVYCNVPSNVRGAADAFSELQKAVDAIKVEVPHSRYQHEGCHHMDYDDIVRRHVNMVA
jgi:hypothetical protein